MTLGKFVDELVISPFEIHQWRIPFPLLNPTPKKTETNSFLKGKPNSFSLSWSRTIWYNPWHLPQLDWSRINCLASSVFSRHYFSEIFFEKKVNIFFCSRFHLVFGEISQASNCFSGGDLSKRENRSLKPSLLRPSAPTLFHKSISSKNHIQLAEDRFWVSSLLKPKKHFCFITCKWNLLPVDLKQWEVNQGNWL